MKNISLIIPLYNEENRIKKNLHFIQNFLKKKEVEIIFVNDGSDDNSDKIIKNFKSKSKNKKLIKYISYKKNVGKGYAIKKGVLSSKREWILICDLDMSVKPSQIDIWYKKKYILKKNEAYFGSRTHSLSKIKTSFVRKQLGVIFNLIIFFLFGIKIKDTQCGFKLFNKNYAKFVFREISSYRFSFDVELVLLLKKKNIKVRELPVNWVHESGSKLNIFFDIPLMLYDLLKIRFKNI